MDSTAQAPEITPPALVVMIVHGTFPRRPWQQLRRNLRALWARVRRLQLDEAAMWPAPESQPDRRWWFESGSEFERDVVRRSGLDIVFDRFLWSGRNTFADRAEAARSLRTALQEAGLKHPGVPQVVLAHSHGGTVAVKALDMREESRGGGVTPNVRALLTMGTPFVRLVWRWRWGPTSQDGKHRVALRVATLLPVMLLALAPLMAVALGRNSEGVVLAVAVVLGVAGLIAAWRASFIAATMVIIFASFLGGRLFLLSLAGQVFILTLMATMDVWVDVGPVKRFLRRWVLDFFKAGRRQVEDEPLCLPCPLLALRAPRDEASLVIGLGQVAQGLPNAAAWLFYTAQRWPILRQFVLLVMMLLAVPAFMAFFWLPVETHDPPSIWEVILSLSYLGLLLLIVPPSVLLLVVLLLAVLAAMGISLTTGREAFMLPVVTRVEAEPLPNARASDGLRRAEMDLEILYDVRPAGLNHSLYDASEVRDRIAIWLREQAVSSAPSC